MLSGSSRRFRVALSFAGAKRTYVAQVADLLAQQFGQEVILYDKYHEAEFAIFNLGTYLAGLYSKESDLVVPVICRDYAKNRWPTLEWNSIYELFTQSDGHRVMLCRFEYATAEGLSANAGFVDLDHKTPEEAVVLILRRLALNEGRPANFYLRTPNEQILSQHSDPIHSVQSQSLPFRAVPPYAHTHEFMGREDQLDVLSDWASPNDSHPILLFEAIGGMGKSMLTWEWVTNHATKERTDWAGRFWYSFYEKGAVLADFCQHALAYMTDVPLEDLKKKKIAELADHLLKELQQRPWLLVLDGLERILVAYHRVDAPLLADDQVDTAEDQIAKRYPYNAIDPEDDTFLKRLATKSPSKILITTRLTPSALLNSVNLPIMGVQRELLGSMRLSDAEALFRNCGIRGNSQTMQGYLQKYCAGHPLVICVLAGIILKSLRHRGNFDSWFADPSTTGRLELENLDLRQKRNHILHRAINDLAKESLELLSLLAVIAESVDVETLQALNPHLPPEPEEPTYAYDFLKRVTSKNIGDERFKQQIDHYERVIQRYEQAVKDRLRAMPLAQQKLEETVLDLQQRGLLRYNAQSNTYELHPVVRGVIFERLTREDKEDYGQRIVDHFSQKSHSSYEEAETLEDVRPVLHVVRTLLSMEQYEQAYHAFLELGNTLLYHLEAHYEVLALLRPFFPQGWDILPDEPTQAEGLDQDAYISLAEVAARALWLIDENQEALRINSVVLARRLKAEDWREVAYSLHSLSTVFNSKDSLAVSQRAANLAFDFAATSNDNTAILLSRRRSFEWAVILGQYEKAKLIWADINKDSTWGYEFWYAAMLFWEGTLSEEVLVETEKHLRAKRDRCHLRNLHTLRGEWRMRQADWNMASESFQEAVRMAREVGLPCEREEVWLALAKFYLGQLPDARHEAKKFSHSHRPLARLWLAIGDHEQARQYALAAYKEAWSDGEPYVYRYALTEAAAILTELGEPIPNLPPYDESKAQKLPLEDELLTALEELRAGTENTEDE